MTKPLRVLVLEDSTLDAEVVIRELRRAGFDPDWKRVETKVDFLAALDTSPELLLSDYSLPHFDGVRAVQLLRERGLDIPFILISGTLGEEAAVEAMKLGATDYLLKDRITRLGSAVERALEEKRLRDERRRVGEELRESEARFRATFEQAAVGVARLTPEGRWLEVNQRLCDIVGYTREELLTKTFQDITHPDDLETDLGFVRQMLAGEIQTYALEKRYWRKDGSLVWINLTVSLVRQPAGAPRYFISVIEDIHARKQAEAALRQLNAELEQRVAERTAELEEANRELDSFSHSVSHDLRAPLRAISGFGQFLEEECAPALDERGRGYIRRMLQSASQMSRLIDDLLQFAHASRSEMRRQPVDLTALAQEVMRDLQQAAPERQVQFFCAPGLSVSGDARLLRVVLVNLLGNAWKYTGKAAEPRVEFGRLDADGETSFFIRDNGAGFDMRYVDRLFGAFQRLHSMAEFEGTGVGLATVQRIIHRHGGKIRAEAKVNEGATFYFTLPEASSSPAHGGNAG